MIKHIVFFKLKDAKNAPELKQKLLALAPEIDFAQIEVGIDFSAEDRACDVALVVSIGSRQDLKNYATHPKQVEFLSYAKPLCEYTKVVDYEL
ncbi:MAG: stress responsive protein [Deltaproteobacteria bacterium]|nr:MAG: stress responsive protein [Deltaproteobacteria bacterium]